MTAFLEQIISDCREFTEKGKVATYIPELANVDATKLGIYISTNDGKEYFAGECFDLFTIMQAFKFWQDSAELGI